MKIKILEMITVFLGFLFAIDVIWSSLEKALYGYTTPSLVDFVMAVIQGSDLGLCPVLTRW